MASTVFDALDRHGVEAHRLLVEITESALLDDVEHAAHQLVQLRERGIRIALDDFGTGYSSLSALQQFPINTLKIDKSFITDFKTENEDKSAIVNAIMVMAEQLDITTKNCTVEKEGHALIVTLNRPEAKNAVNKAVAEGVAAAMDELDGNDTIRVAILTGAEGGFCSGMDLKAFVTGEMPMVEGRGFAGVTERLPQKPLIAAVEGFALAGGLELMISCDLIVAADNVKIGIPEVKRGLAAAAGGLVEGLRGGARGEREGQQCGGRRLHVGSLPSSVDAQRERDEVGADLVLVDGDGLGDRLRRVVRGRPGPAAGGGVAHAGRAAVGGGGRVHHVHVGVPIHVHNRHGGGPHAA